jgi:L,D-peptidoglycan transpeptidase YkuD (ErfK/YbiS/YcfS/YnhG family)
MCPKVDHMRASRGLPVRSARVRLTLGIMLTALAVLAGLVPAASPAQAAALPDLLESKGDARQLIVVKANNWSTSFARLEVWNKYSTGWRLSASFPARLGSTGFEWASKRRQDDGSTPAGTFTITQTFGISPNPGTKMPFRRVWNNDYWVYDKRCPATYNTWQKYGTKRCWRTSWAEHLKSYRPEYDMAAVINFNRPGGGKPADVRRGGGIFLHINGSGATAGCVSLRRGDMARVMRWLDPQRKPRIIMAPSSVITRL